MSAMREKDQADWDLERCFEMFDEALISRDERVINSLRNLLMIVTLTAPETELSGIERRTGPLRRIMEDHDHLVRRVVAMEDELRTLRDRISLTPQIKGLDLHQNSNWPYSGGPGAGGRYAGAAGLALAGNFSGLKDDEC
jgi:hypothetical protein